MSISSTGLIEWTPLEGVTYSGEVTVSVFDGGEDGAAAAVEQFTVSVTSVNDPPVIISMASTAAAEDMLYSYQVAVADPDDANNGTDLSFSLSNEPSGMTISSLGLIEWTPLEGVTSSGDVTVIAADGGEDGAAGATELFTVTVTTINDPPLIASTAPTSATEDMPYSYQVVVSDPDDANDGMDLSFSLVNEPAGMTISSTGLIEWTPVEGVSSSGEVTVSVADDGEDGAEAGVESFTVAVTSVNDPPSITSTAPPAATEDMPYSYQMAVVDPDDANNGTDLIFNLIDAPTGMTVSNTGLIEWTPVEGETSSGGVTVTVSDGGEDGAAAASELFTVSVTSVNDVPVITSTAPTAATEDVLYSYQVMIDDPDDANNGTDLAFSLTNAPAGMTISGTGRIEWTPLEGVANSGDVTLTVSDGGEDGATTATELFAIAVAAVNDAPVITSTASILATEDVLYSYQVTVNDPDDTNNGTDLIFNLIDAPTGMTVSNTGLIEWTPFEGETSSGGVTVTVSDGGEDGAAAASELFTVSVTSVNDAPVITSTAPTAATEDVLYSYQVMIDDPDDANNGTDLTFSLFNEPSGMTVSSAGLIEWTPIEGVVTSGAVTVSVADGGEDATTAATEIFTVAVTVVNDPPVITSAAPISATEDILYSYQVTVADPDDINNGTDPNFILSNEPAGMTISNTGLIEWIPEEGVTTSGDVTVTVADGGEDGAAAATEIFTVAVLTVNDAPVITSTAPVTATEDILYNYQVTVADPDDVNNGADLTFSLLDEPEGMTISGTGLIGWTPLEGVTSSGEVTVSVVDGGEDGALAATERFTVAVTEVNDAPLITSAASNTATEDVLYSYQVIVDDPDDANNGADLIFNLTDAPTGMTVSNTGLIEWTPLEGEVSSGDVTVTVVDGGEDGAAAATELFTVSVTSVNDTPIITSTAPTAATEDVLYSYQVVVNDPDDANNGTDLTFILINAPAGMTISGTGLIEWTPLEGVVSSGEVTLTVADGGEDGAAAGSEKFTLAVTAVNDAPTDIALSSSSINENLPSGTLVGTFASTDTDVGDSHSYSLVESGIDDDWMYFTIAGNELRSSSIFDYELVSSYSLLVRTQDEEGEIFEKPFTIVVNNLSNEAPLGVTLTNSTISENQPIGTTIGIFSTTDQDIGQNHVYSMAEGLDDDDNASFSILGDVLKTAAGLDFESKSTYKIRVKTDDQHGGAFEEKLTITVIDANDAPTDIVLSNNAVAENQDAGSIVGILTTLDQDTADGHTYSLVSGTGAADNGMFAISGNGIRAAASFDYESRSSYSIRVRTVDQSSSVFEAQITITVLNENESPTVQSTSFSLAENAANNTPVGTVAALDPDAADSLTYSITAGNAGGVFAIDSGSGVITVADNSTLNFEATPSYFLTVAVTDLGALSADAFITIDIADINATPLITGQAAVSTAEDTELTITLSALNVTDPDNAYPAGFTLGVADGANYSRSGHTITPSPDFSGILTVPVTVDDGENANSTSAVFDLMVTVTAVNDGPVINSTAPSSATEDVLFSYPVTVTDPDDANNGLDLSFNLINAPTGMTISNTGLIEWTPLEGVVSSGTVTVTVADGGEDGAAAGSQSFTLAVTPVNDPPTDITLSNNTIDENLPSGVPVGTFTSTDTDAGDNHTYSLVEVGTDDDWMHFTIVGNELRSSSIFDYELINSYSLLVRSQDLSGEFFEKQFTIIVNNLNNEAPLGVTLTNTAISENQPIGTTVGIFSTTDQDIGQIHLYSMAEGIDDDDNDSFTIAGDALQTAAEFDFEYQSTYKIRVRTDDQHGGAFEQKLTITVIDANEAPLATDDAVSTHAETPVIIEVLANDRDEDGDGFSLTGVTQAADGVVTDNGDNTVTYTPNADFIGQDAFTYEISDGRGGSNTATVSVNVYAGRFTFSWDPSDSPEVVGYEVYIGNAPRDYTQTIDVGNVTSYDIWLAEKLVTYYFSVAGYDSEGQAIDFYKPEASARVTDVDQITTSINYEDAWNTTVTGWVVSDDDPAGAAIANVYDTDLHSRVIEFAGSGTANGYQLRKTNGSPWYDSSRIVLEWSMQYSEKFEVYIDVMTTAGQRYLYYTPVDESSLGGGVYVHHGLGSYVIDGQWRKIVSDLQSDLEDAQPGVNILEINGFRIHGSGRVDDIKLLSAMPVSWDNDGDGLADVDERGVYETDPYKKDTDEDGIDDGEELALWGTDWNADYDNDGLNNLVDIDSDDDGVQDNAEIVQGFDPADNSSTPSQPIYEDAEDNMTDGWIVYDNDPVGAAVANVYDTDRGSRVIELAGSGTANGYQLRKANGSPWRDESRFILEWSMRYSENFEVLIDVMTTAGQRYIYYTPVDDSSLGGGVYVHHGLGTDVRDGQWHTIISDLQADLEDAQPGVSILEVNGFRIHGSGRVDDIKLLSAMPLSWDNDGDGLADVDERSVYETDPYKRDTDGDGMGDGEELSFWGADWGIDYDGDGLNNLVDMDSDNDSVHDHAEIVQGFDPADNSDTPSQTIYEDAEDNTTDGWKVLFVDNPAGVVIANVYDTDRQSRVIELSGSGTADGYYLSKASGSPWRDSSRFVIEWSMRYSEHFYVFIDVETTAGQRYIYYTPVDDSNFGNGAYVQYGLGSDAKDGQWRTFVRDLQADLEAAQPGISILEVNGFRIHGSGRVDDITLMRILDNDKDGLADVDETDIYETDPHKIDTDGDGMGDGAELSFWGADWDIDYDGDGLNNLVDIDSDNDGVQDLAEIVQGYDPADNTSAPLQTIYEDAEDDTTDGWVVSDDDPAGAAITNVYDTDRQSRVIEFAGSGTANGYQLRKAYGGPWLDSSRFILEWSMRYSEKFEVYIDVMTTAGQRYIYYTPVGYNNLGNGVHVHHGLGSYVIDGQWHTIVNDLQADLEDAQPGVSILEVNGFRIHGNGRVDDIKLLSAMPVSWDNDGDGLSDVDERGVYETDPYKKDTDEDGIDDGEELVFWDIDWSIDYDSDDLNNLVDIDSDNDGVQDNAEIVRGYDPGDNSSTPSQPIYEDAEDNTTDGWIVYDDDPAGAVIANVYDTDRGSRVIELAGSGTANGYHLRKANGSPWHETSRFKIEWSMRYSERFEVLVDVMTTAGQRYLYYTPVDYDNLGGSVYVHYGLGSDVIDGQWHTIVSDLQADLEDAQPGVSILEVNGFRILGSGRVDDIKLLSAVPVSWDTDGDGIADVDERDVYETDPYKRDTDGDGMGDGDELSFWGADWDIDYDGDGLNNLVDMDSDNDGVHDHAEIVQGFDPGDSSATPSQTIYEDAEDSTTEGWIVLYDSDPPGAVISNVYDTDRQSRVIELSGSGTASGYYLGKANGSPWLDSNRFIIEWSMRYSEHFYVFVDVETTAGHRYIYYTPVDSDSLGSGAYVQYGLGSDVKDGQWRTFVRDLQADLEAAQPGVSILEVNGFRIHGSGRVDDIKLKNSS